MKSCVKSFKTHPHKIGIHHIHASQVHMRSPSSSWNSSNEFKSISSNIVTARTIIIV
jgi:hypothetical protein